MGDVQRLDVAISPRPAIWQSTVKSAASNMVFQESSSLPAMSLLGVVTRNDHQRAQDDVGVARGLDGSMTDSQEVSSGSPSTVPMKTFS